MMRDQVCLFQLFCSVVVFFGCSMMLFAQESLEPEARLTIEKKRLLILPCKQDSSETYPIENEITNVVGGIATRMGRFEVINRNNLKRILEEQAIRLSGVIDDSTVINVGQIASANEALIIDVQSFSQRGVPREEESDDEDENDQDFWSQLASSVVRGIFSGDDAQDYEDNIETQLSVMVREINVETGESIDALDIDVVHTGGTRGKSRGEAIKKFKKKLMHELKSLYLLNSQVVSVDNDEVLLFLGSQVGVSKGTVFEIVEPERKKNIQGREFFIPGRTAGYVSVSDIATETNRSVVLRQWKPIREGYTALEHSGSFHGIIIEVVPPIEQSYLGIGLFYNWRPIYKSNLGIGLRFIRVKDSYGDQNFGFGFGGSGNLRIISSSTINLNAAIGVDLDLPIRSDTQDHTVTAPIFSAHAGIKADILLTSKNDFIVYMGYRFAGKTNNWEYTVEEETHAGVWENGAPEIDISGFFITVGYRIIIF